MPYNLVHVGIDKLNRISAMSNKTSVIKNAAVFSSFDTLGFHLHANKRHRPPYKYHILIETRDAQNIFIVVKFIDKKNEKSTGDGFAYPYGRVNLGITIK